MSPAEPQFFRDFGITSSIPEKFGADFYFDVDGKSVGVQRKEVRDLVNSIHDARLAKELGQMKAVDIPVLIIEGDFQWATTGASLRVSGWSRTQHRGLMFSLSSQGLWILSAETQAETIECVFALKKWLEKGTHSLLRNRPKAESSWGKATSRDWGVHMLQSFDGVGVGVAEKIYDHFGGVPLAWTITETELMGVKGVGKKRASSLIQALPHPESLTSIPRPSPLSKGTADSSSPRESRTTSEIVDLSNPQADVVDLSTPQT